MAWSRARVLPPPDVPLTSRQQALLTEPADPHTFVPSLFSDGPGAERWSAGPEVIVLAHFGRAVTLRGPSSKRARGSPTLRRPSWRWRMNCLRRWWWRVGKDEATRWRCGSPHR